MKIGDNFVKVLSKDSVEIGCVVVTRQQALEVIASMNEWKPKPSLKVILPSVISAVIGPHQYVRIGIEFCECRNCFHDLDGITADGHGY